MYEPRFYRKWARPNGLVDFEVVEEETDLYICAEKDLSRQARVSIIKYRQQLKDYGKLHAEFVSSLVPIRLRDGAPLIAKEMAEAAAKAKVGPMAAVAGAVAEFVGKELLSCTKELIIENGGDIYLNTSRELTIGVFAGRSPLSGKVSIRIKPGGRGMGVCTSSATVGHSLSFGRADAAVVISESAALADAAATAVCNSVKTADDIEASLELAKNIPGIKGALIIIGESLGAWGEIEIV